MQFLTLQKARSCLSPFQVGFVRLRIPVTRRCSESCPDFSQWGELLWYSWWFVYFLRPLDESSFKTWIKMTQTIINRIKTGIWKVTFLQNTGKMMEQVCEVNMRQRANRFEECEAAESVPTITFQWRYFVPCARCFCALCNGKQPSLSIALFCRLPAIWIKEDQWTTKIDLM